MMELVASLADIYESGKSIQTYLLDPKEKKIKTSTRINFNETDLTAQIMHNGYETSERIIVPEFNFKRLEDLLNNQDPEISIFLQKLFNTKDKIEKIIETVESLSGVKRPEIKISTPFKMYRKTCPKRSVAIGINAEMLHIDAYQVP